MHQPMLYSNVSRETVREMEKIFNSHKHILKAYTDLRIPKHILKEMARELEEFYNKNHAQQNG